MKLLFVFVFLLVAATSIAQPVSTRLEAAIAAMEKTDAFAHAIIGFYVVNNKTGEVVLDKNGELGLAPASTLKVVTSATAFEMLGKDFVYETKFSLDGKINKGIFNGELKVQPSGDPTLGSWRWKTTGQQQVASALATALKQKDIKFVNGVVRINSEGWELMATPDGWIWEDVGNYYGAGARLLNWHENSYKLVLKPGKKIGDSVQMLETDPRIPAITWINEITTAKAGSGDNAVIYFPERATIAHLRGTIPAGVEKFTIRGSIPRVEPVFLTELKKYLEKNEVKLNSRLAPTIGLRGLAATPAAANPLNEMPLLTIQSPELDSINYWFMRESINLYGEALLKTMAHKKKGRGETAIGVKLVNDFWKDKGIDAGAIKMHDGSGLSPANRITPHALVTVLQHASGQTWFPSFYNALPLQNNIKMKSGYISGVRSYAGYIKSKTGEEYSFAFIINNFDGSAASVREKMWQVLDLLK